MFLVRDDLVFLQNLSNMQVLSFCILAEAGVFESEEHVVDLVAPKIGGRTSHHAGTTGSQA